MSLPRITVHPGGHYLMTEAGAPFFWLGDTVWCLPARLTPDEAEHLLATRARQGFNVIMMTALSEFDGLRVPNPAGDLPFDDMDPTRPNERFFAYVDWIIKRAADHGLYIGLLPTWGDKVTSKWGDGPAVFFDNPAHAQAYGAWLGTRYRAATNVIWVLGGDRPAIMGEERRPHTTPTFDYRPIWRAMAAGIEQGAGQHTLTTYHTWGGLPRTSQQIHDEAWLDVNGMQSGHGGGHDVAVWDWVEEDFARTPAKPTLDLEPNYEDHPVSPWPTWDPATGFFREGDVRRQCYRSVFAGGCGVTYGHHSMWQLAAPRYKPINYACMYWTEAIERPGANHIGYLRRLMESRPFFDRVPNQALIANGQGQGRAHIRATSDAHGRYAMLFVPDAAGSFSVDLSHITGDVRAAWYDTHTGMSYPAGDYPAASTQQFNAPLPWHDWVLVLDAAAEGYGAPGHP